MKENPKPGVEASFFLQDAEVHLMRRLGTAEFERIHMLDTADYAALQILHALAMLCLYGPETPPRTTRSWIWGEN